MGLTGLLKWHNPPENGLALITEILQRDYNATQVMRHSMQLQSYRSSGLSDSSNKERQLFTVHSSTSMITSKYIYVLIDDITKTLVGPNDDVEEVRTRTDGSGNRVHTRHTMVSLTPPMSLTMLLGGLKSPFVVPNAKAQSNTAAMGAGSAPKEQGGPRNTVRIEGFVWDVGGLGGKGDFADWVVRAGTVTSQGGTSRGIMIEAEYLPLSSHPPDVTKDDTTMNLISAFLLSLLPPPSPSPSAPQPTEWKWVIPNVPALVWSQIGVKIPSLRPVLGAQKDEQGSDNIKMHPEGQKMEIFDEDEPEGWVGVERGRRVAYLLIGQLRSEGYL